MQDTAHAQQGGTTAKKDHDAHMLFARANALRMSGKLDEAEPILDAILGKFPEYVAALVSLGQIQVARNQYGRALPLFIKAVMLCPHDWMTLANLGHLYNLMGATEVAARTLDWADAIGPDDAEIQFARAMVYSEQREYRAAIDLLRKVRKAAPDHLGAAFCLGNCCAAVGLVSEAADAFTAATESPEFGNFVIYALSQLPPAVVNVDVLAMADRIGNDLSTQLDERSRTRLQFARAAAMHGRKSYDDAWRVLLDANAAAAAQQSDLYRRRHDEQKRYLTMASTGSDRPPGGSLSDRQGDPVSLFVLGPSCSGKTTLERFFDGVPGVKLGYENYLVDYSAQQVCRIAGLLSVRRLADLPSHLDDRFREFYSPALRRKCNGAGVFTNTMPDNIVNVGRIHSLVPGARFVFISRDSLDVAFRIFLSHYEPLSNSYAYDLQSIRDHLAWYAAMAETWSVRFPETCLNLSYEEIVVDPRNAVARVSELCGMTVATPATLDIGDDRGCAAPYADRMRPVFEA